MVLLRILRAILRLFGLSTSAASEIEPHSGTLQDVDGSAAQRAEDEVAHYPYRRRDDFLSPAERNFFRILYQAVGENALICAKVNLADLFYVPSRDSAEYRVYTNKIDRKHVDFVLCDPQTLTPRLGIELDDRSHERADRQQRDYFVSNVFAEAGLPLLRVKVQRSYALQELTELVKGYLEAPPQANGIEANSLIPQAEPSLVAGEAASPTCPKCGSKMVLRRTRDGANTGKHFWGCSNYPRCRAMLAYVPVPAIS